MMKSKLALTNNIDRIRRLRWWQESRFGMFVHWGLYSQLQRHEWVMNFERIPVPEYEKLADTWKPKPRPARLWARLAKAAGMKYMVMTTKHHEGFCLWDSKMTDYNAVKRGPGRDLVREYVEACREFGLKIGVYYSLMDWHHPDGANCKNDDAARRRFLDFTQGCVRELMSNYGKIDVLWYDVSWPLVGADAWESAKMNAIARKLQPHILINNRSQLPEDFGTPEEHIKAESSGRAWEACMTFNGSWGYQPAPPEDWHSVRDVLEMLRKVTAGQGNLLLNIGPKADGSVPPEALDRLEKIGRWIDLNREVIYGRPDRVAGMAGIPTGNWTRKGKTLYFWCSRWPGRELAIGGLKGKLKKASLMAGGRKIGFEQTGDRLVLKGLPEKSPDKIAGVTVMKMEFAKVPCQLLGTGCVFGSVPPWQSPWMAEALFSRLMPKDNLARAKCVRLNQPMGWEKVVAGPQGIINVNQYYEHENGIAYVGGKFKVEQSGSWTLSVGYDGGARVFLDGKAVLCDPVLINPSVPGRSKLEVKLARGVHELMIAEDMACGLGGCLFICFETPAALRTPGKKPRFPKFLKV